MRTLRILAVLLLAVPAAGAAREIPVAIVGARVLSMAGPEIAEGTVVFSGGKIVAAGPSGKVKAPPGAEVIDGCGLWLMPGLIDPASTAALPGQRPGGGTTPQRDATPALDPRSPDLLAARRGGYTTLVILRDGSGVPGTGVAVATAGETIGEMVVARGVCLRMRGGKGTPAIQGLRGVLEAAKKEIDALAKYEADRAAFEKASAEYAKALEEAKKKGEKPPAAPKDLKRPAAPKVKESMEAVRKAVRGEIPLSVRLADANEVLHFGDVTEGFGELRVVVDFAGGDAGRIVDTLAARKWSIVLAPALGYEPWTRTIVNVPARLHAAKVPFAFRSPRDPEDALLSLAFLVRAGLPRDAALAAVTIGAARTMGLEKRLGSIEKGKDANLVLLSGDPLDAETRIERVFLGGRTIWPGEGAR